MKRAYGPFSYLTISFNQGGFDVEKIIIVGLGPGNPGSLSMEAYEFLTSGVRVILRTGIHPTVDWLIQKGWQFETMDKYYQQAANFEEVYSNIAGEILNLAEREPVIYGVPGHPMVAEESVRLIMEQARVRQLAVKVVPAMSFLDALLPLVQADPAAGLHIIDALRLDEQKPDVLVGNVITQVYDRVVAGETKLTLMEYYGDEYPVTVVRAAGVPGQEQVTQIPLYQLDRLTGIDHLTSLYLAPVSEPDSLATEPAAVDRVGAGVDISYQSCSYPLDSLVEVMATLRSESGCPWDREQTRESLKKYLIEESYEVIEALDEGEEYKICEELGDLLLQIVFHAQIARENDRFDINNVVQVVTEKMIRRHPHVFGTTAVKDSDEVLVNWDKIKSQEKGMSARKSYLDGIPRMMPALLRAEKVQAKAARVGFDWPDYQGALDKVNEELAEVKEAIVLNQPDQVKLELGDLLFAVVNLARLLKVEAEDALSKTIGKFMQRFCYIERRAGENNRKLSELSLTEMDRWWEEAKIKENK